MESESKAEKKAKSKRRHRSKESDSDRHSRHRSDRRSEQHSDWYSDLYWERYSDRYSDRHSERLSDHYSEWHSDRHSERHSHSRKHSKKHCHKHSKRKHSRKKERINKEALLDIAKQNLAKMIEKGDLPKNTDISKLKLKHLRELTTQKSVSEWTELCRAISAMEAAAYSDLSSDLDSDSDSDYQSSLVDSYTDKDVRHPFRLKERRDIEIRVRDFVQLQSRTAKEVQKELREQFPVSSGSHHRIKEHEWTEVKPDSPKKPKKKVKSEHEKVDESNIDQNIETNTFQSKNSLDIGTIMSQRLNAMRKLQEDPYNVVAIKQMYNAQEMMQDWARSQAHAGQYNGSTGTKSLSIEELEGDFPVWTKKNQLLKAEPIKEGIGMHLLMKMGWKPGEGLGKNKEGLTDPVLPVLKFDTKGLVAESEVVKNLPMQLVTISETPVKHPVSMLQEYCSKKKWLVPQYELIQETGPDHKKNFLMKVIVNGVEYQPSVTCPNKKQAKALCATVYSYFLKGRV
ncbi:protein SON-like isoform X1 [Dinothrombium tinctorium]|uniref:Protein SON-like isoform X1 n=1 Tax=Dinothrombium tinctorium TaxID=1965070 RepID=A0A3S3PNU0_9ACAR|nr:protein SON-like isoform X1 [Dinothrombium tinctorium]